MLIESGMVYGVKIWGVYGCWEETEVTDGRFCKKIIGVHRLCLMAQHNYKYG
jgi:hypothetical protein